MEDHVEDLPIRGTISGAANLNAAQLKNRGTLHVWVNKSQVQNDYCRASL